jgi:prepilin-type processing-associated H-X9-DG protein
MEVLVVVATILVLAAILVPTVSTFQNKSHKAEAIRALKELATAAQAYATDRNDELPQEDAAGTDNWQAAADPANRKAWYNALLASMGRRTVADYALSPRAFYTKENILFLPGAKYPESDKKLIKPLFAIAINSRLQRRDEDGNKPPVRRAQISDPARTVLFLENGLPPEKKAVPVQSKKDYNGSSKGTAKTFPGRYSGLGVLAFVDGHVEEHVPAELLTETGLFPFPPTDVIWCRTPEEDPNK